MTSADCGLTKKPSASSLPTPSYSSQSIVSGASSTTGVVDVSHPIGSEASSQMHTVYTPEEENARLQRELDDVTLQLVNARISIANLHMDMDKERKKYADLRNRMHQQMSALAASEGSEADQGNTKSGCFALFNCCRPRPDPRRKFGRVLSVDPVLLEDVDDDVIATKTSLGMRGRASSSSTMTPPTTSKPESVIVSGGGASKSSSVAGRGQGRVPSLEVSVPVGCSNTTSGTTSTSLPRSSHNSTTSVPSGGTMDPTKAKRTPSQRHVGKKKNVDTTGVPKPSWLN